MRYRTFLLLGLVAAGTTGSPAFSFTVNPVTTDIFTLGVYADAASPIKATRTGYLGNPAELFHIGGAGQSGGTSFLIPVSNGQAPGGPANPSGPRTGDAIDIANGGDGTENHRLQDGNTFRFSVWMRINPDDPVTYEPSVEPVMKFELWKLAQSTNTDYSIGHELWAAAGDRLWDTDIQASDDFFKAHNQSQAAHFDISGNGTVIGPNATTPAADGTVVAGQWKLFQSTITIDDSPDGNGLGWLIGSTRYKVDQLQEVRATFFTGDYFGTAPAAGGSFFVDNALLEVFPDAAAMAATPNPNPMPQPAPVGDYNNNGIVDAADYTVWRDHLGQSGAALANRDPSVTGLVKAADYTVWQTHFGAGAGSGAGALNYSVIGYAPRSAAVPEPATIVLSVLACIGLAGFANRR